VHQCKDNEEVERTLDGSLQYQVKDIKTETTEEAGDIKAQTAAQTATDGQEIPPANGTAHIETDGPQTIWTTTFYLGIGLKKGEYTHGIVTISG
jgi:poly(A) polymerase